MKKILVTVVLMVIAIPAFAQSQYMLGVICLAGTSGVTVNTDAAVQGRGSYFMSGLFGRRKDLQDCRTVIKGGGSALEMAQLMGATKGGLQTHIDPATGDVTTYFQ